MQSSGAIFSFLQGIAVLAAPAEETKSVANAIETWENQIFSLGIWQTIAFAAIVALITFVILRLFKRIIKRHSHSNLRIFYRLIYVLVIVIAVFIVLMTINPLKSIATTILASSGIAAVVVGLAAQQTLGNLFSGISISTSKVFEIGEYVEVLDLTPPVMGYVTETGLRHTVIQDISNKKIIIPNSIMDKSVLRTAHLLDAQNIKSTLEIRIAYESDIDLAIHILRDLASNHPDTIDVRTEEEKQQDIPKVTIRITDLSDTGIQLSAFFWTENFTTSFSTLSDLRYQVLKAFQKQGVSVAYPHRIVSIQPEKPE